MKQDEPKTIGRFRVDLVPVLANGTMKLTITRREDGASFEVPLQHIDSWIAEVIGYASGSFAKMLASTDDGTIPQPKPAQWVQVDLS